MKFIAEKETVVGKDITRTKVEVDSKDILYITTPRNIPVLNEIVLNDGERNLYISSLADVIKDENGNRTATYNFDFDYVFLPGGGLNTCSHDGYVLFWDNVKSITSKRTSAFDYLVEYPVTVYYIEIELNNGETLRYLGRVLIKDLNWKMEYTNLHVGLKDMCKERNINFIEREED